MYITGLDMKKAGVRTAFESQGTIMSIKSQKSFSFFPFISKRKAWIVTYDEESGRKNALTHNGMDVNGTKIRIEMYPVIESKTKRAFDKKSDKNATGAKSPENASATPAKPTGEIKSEFVVLADLLIKRKEAESGTPGIQFMGLLVAHPSSQVSQEARNTFFFPPSPMTTSHSDC